MSSTTTITIDKLARLIGTPKCPAVDRRPHRGGLRGRSPPDPGLGAPPASLGIGMGRGIRGPRGGRRLPAGAEAERGRRRLAAPRRACRPRSLEGGFEAWRQAGLPLVPAAKLPPRDSRGRTVWVTRARPKIDRIACPWLIRRFVDPDAVFLFVAPAEVAGRRRALRRRRRSTSRTCSGAIAARPAPSTR